MIIKDLSTSEETSESQAEQLSESETQVEEISSTESVEESEVASDEDFLLIIRHQVNQRAYQSQKKAKSLWITNFADVMADYYAKKAQVAAAAEKGETVYF